MRRKFTIKLISVLFITLLVLGSFGIIKNSNALMPTVDIVTAPAQISLGVTQTATSLWDKAYNYVKDFAKQTGAVLYKQAVGTVINSLAADTAKAIATGDWGSPVFNFDSGYYSALADGVVGDTLNDVVNGLTGVDLCNYDPTFTLKAGLELPFLRTPDQYEPRCSLTKIAEEASKIDLKNAFKIDLNITSKTYDSFSELASSLTGTTPITKSVLAISIANLNNKYGNESSDYSKKEKTFIEAAKSFIADEANAARLDLRTDEQFTKELQRLSCEILADLQFYNLAINDTSDFSNNKYKFYSGCNENKDSSDNPINFNLEPFKNWQVKSDDWYRDDDEDKKLFEEMDEKAKKTKEPIDKGIVRVAYLYNTCLNELNKNLSVTKIGSENVQYKDGKIIDKRNVEGKGTKQLKETFYAKVPDPSNATSLVEKWITYTQNGDGITEKGSIACQIVFNSGYLLRSYGTEGSYGYIQGANNIDFNALFGGDTVVGSVTGSNQLGEFSAIFNSNYLQTKIAENIVLNIKATTPSSFFQDFIKYTIVQDEIEIGKGAKMRQVFLDAINQSSAMVFATQGVLSKKITSLENLSKKAIEVIKSNDNRGTSGKEKLEDFNKALSPEGNELATSGELANNLLDQKYDKYSKEQLYALEKGSILNSDKTAVSEVAKNVPEVKKSDLDSSIKGQSPYLEYTGEIFADGLTIFLSTFWHELAIRGLSEMNSRVAKSDSKFIQNNLNIKISGELQAEVDAQKACKKDPTQCTYAIKGFNPNTSKCTKNDLNITTAWTNLKKSLGGILKSGSGKLSGLSDDCQSAIDQAVEESGESVDPEIEKKNTNNNTGNIKSDIVTTLETTQRPESGNSTTYVSAFENANFPEITNPDNDFNILSELSTCPGGEVNPTLYNCTIKPVFISAIAESVTISQAINKKYLERSMYIGVDNTGKPAIVNNGFSLSAIQKLRKLRIMPLGLEFAARLKVACYQKNTKNKVYPPIPLSGIYPYRDISDECEFNTDNDQQPFIDAVVNANLGDILDGFDDDNGDCGNFEVVDGQPNISPFCGLVNPDWVIKLPETKCDQSGYGEIIESNKSNSRYINCTQIKQEVVNTKSNEKTYGYCLKEENIWNFTGNTCPSYANTCEALVFNDNSVYAFNKDSLVGDQLCNEKNAGCIWTSTVKIANIWRDTLNLTNRFDCINSGGEWIDNKCTNSRLYLNDNIEDCPEQDNGCSEVKLFKRSGNNLVRDGSFEYATAGEIHPLWTVEEVKSSVTEQSCIDGGGVAKSSCVDVPFTTFAECTSNGGTWDGDISECSGGVLNNINETDCTIADGTYSENCVKQDIQCSNDIGICSIDYSQWNNDKDRCESEIFGGYYDELEKACLSSSSGPVIDTSKYENNKDLCLRNGGEFILSCPLEVVQGNSSDGFNSLKADLAHYTITSDYDKLVLIYPVKLENNQSALILPGDTYSVSFNIKSDFNVSGSAELIKTFNSGKVDNKIINIDVTQNYTTHKITVSSLTSGTDISLKLSFPVGAVNVFVDQVKIEFNTAYQIFNKLPLSNRYSDYVNNASVSLKIPPDYLECKGYDAGHISPKAKQFTDQATCQFNNLYWDIENIYGGGTGCYKYEPDNDLCSNFARMCEPQESGCQIYTPLNSDPKVPGVISQNDYCPIECVGYDSFRQEPSYFEQNPSAQLNYFIPATAQQCAIADVGCDEFTNLTNNTIDNYSYLKQCITPDSGQGEASYFIWQGTNNGSPQLKTFSLKAGSGGGPAVVFSSGNCTSADVGVDLTCLEYFDTSGNSYFRRHPYTIVADEGCQTLRKTQSDNNSCTDTNGEWSNGVCLYKTLPEQSASCSAQVSGCREYLGNTGNNLFNLVFDNFENNNNEWSADIINKDVVISNESIIRNGHSLYLNKDINFIQRDVYLLHDKSYIVSMWVKNEIDQTKPIGIKLTYGATSTDLEFSTIADRKALAIGDWKYIELGPLYLHDSDVSNAKLVIKTNETSDVNNRLSVFFDNIILKTLQDSVYVVKDSWKTPQSCDISNLGAKMPQAQLGCQDYADQQGNKQYLKSFAKLCRESSAGCQLVFDTYNSINPLSKTYNTQNNTNQDDVTVKADKLKAVIVDNAYSCTPENKGCSEVGIIQQVSSTSNPSIYVKNNPDRYDSLINPILCKNEELGCVETTNFKADKNYFKINFGDTCTYKENINVSKFTSENNSTTQLVSGWFKDFSDPSKGCLSTDETNQNTCEDKGGSWNYTYQQCTSDVKGLSFKDCSNSTMDIGYKSQLENFCTSANNGYWYDEEEYGCGCARYPFEYYKSSEYPDNHVSAAYCKIEYDQCTEFVDFNPNYVLNGDFEIQKTNGTTLPKNWDEVDESIFAGKTTLISGINTSGSKSVKIYKNTNKDYPSDDYSVLKNTPYYIEQTILNLEKGRKYTVDFDFNSDSNESIGVLGHFDEGVCRSPEAAIEVVPDFTPLKQYSNKENIKIFESNGGWKSGSFDFIVPSDGIIDTEINNKSNCDNVKGTFKDNKCYLNTKNNIDYKMRIYSPLNGACVNQITGVKKYFTDDGLPLDKYLCEGVNDTSNILQAINTDITERYADYNKIIGTQILDIDDTDNLSQGDSWKWDGNCILSNVIYDKLQIAPKRDTNYYFINDGNIDTESCTQTDWDKGCIQFENKITHQNVIIKVKPDRQCSEWLSCTENTSDGYCMNWTTCSELDDNRNCVRVGSQSDLLRYKKTDNGDIDTVNIDNYRKRYGDFAIRISRWRDGEYSGYTIPNLPPIEQLYDVIPGVKKLDTSNPPNEVDIDNPNTPLLTTQKYKVSESEKDAYGINIVKFITDGNNYGLTKICERYPEQTSPFPSLLKKLSPKFSGVNPILESSYNDVAGNVRADICKYVKYSINEQDKYFTDIPTFICIKGDKAGQNCSDGATPAAAVDSQCYSSTSGADIDISGSCVSLNDDPVNTPSEYRRSLNETAISGELGVCLEEDGLIKITGGLIDIDSYGIITDPNEELDQNNTPYACLTFFPKN